MRICFVADAGSIHTKKWVRYFAEKGHEVHLISLKPFYSDKIGNVQYHILRSIPPQIRIISVIINTIWFLVQMRRLVRRIKPDIINGHYITDCGFIAALSGFHPLVISTWGSDVFVDPYKSVINNHIVKFALKRADLVTTMAQYTADYVHSEFNVPSGKIKMFHWGENIDLFQKGYVSEAKTLRKTLNIDDSSFIVLSPRTMGVLYGIEFIIESLPYIIKKHPNVCFVFLKGCSTDSSYENRLQRIAKRAGVEEYTRFVSRYLDKEEMAIYYNMSDVFISIPRTDQFASCIVEGMACGSIPIVGNLEVYREYLTDGNNAFFVDRENPEDIAEKVTYCIEHPEAKERFYEVNREIVKKKLDWSNNAPLMYESYQSLLKVGS